MKKSAKASASSAATSSSAASSSASSAPSTSSSSAASSSAASSVSSVSATVSPAVRVFSLPPIQDSPNGWGPSTALPVQFSDVPFAPFEKNDRLGYFALQSILLLMASTAGRVSDWAAAKQQFSRNDRRADKDADPYNASANANSGSGNSDEKPAPQQLFGYKHEEDEASFETVDARAKTKPKAFGQTKRAFNPNWGRRDDRGGRSNRGGRNQGGSGTGQDGAPTRAVGAGGGWTDRRNQLGRGGGASGKGGRNNWNRYNQQNQEPIVHVNSIDPQEDWKLVQDITFAEISKSSLTPEEPQNLVECGSLDPYNKEFDTVTPKNTKNLQRFDNRQHFTHTTSEDPVLQRLIKEQTGTVYATDTILALLMAAPKSVNSWDVVFKKEKGALVFDKRPDSRIDFWSVNENWNELQNTDKDNVNHPDNLSVEATFISHNFSQQVLGKGPKLEFKEPNPFLDQVQKGNVPASVAFRYRKWDISDSIKLVARTELNAYTVRKEEKVLMSIKALNEFDSKLSGGVDWRQKLDTQPGAVLATETKNNLTKLSRWTAQAVLAGAHEFKLGFVTRMNTKDSYHHIVLQTQRYVPKSFATSISISLPNMWATLKALIDICMKQEDGKYLLLKDASKSIIHLYKVPDSAFANETGEKILADLAPKQSSSR